MFGSDDKDKKAEQQAAAKAYRYRCKENCVLQGKYRKQGEIISLAEEKEVPHFEYVEDEK